MTRRVVVTGVGLVSALGIGTAATWKALCAGQSGIGPVSRFPGGTFRTNFAGEVRGYDPADFVDMAAHANAGLNTKFALGACAQAWDQAGLRHFDGFNQRLGSAKEALAEVEEILEEKEIDGAEIGEILEVANKHKFRRFNPAFKKKQKELTDAAETIARLLKNFAKEFDPRKLSALADEEVVPDVSDSDSISGKPYSP